MVFAEYFQNYTEIIKTVEELDHYPWSGHSTVMENKNNKWMDTEYVLANFGSKKKAVGNAYRKFIEKGVAWVINAKLTGSAGLFAAPEGGSRFCSDYGFGFSFTLIF